MTPEQRLLLRKMFESMMPLPRKFGRLFYERLFELDPKLRRLFHGDIELQATMLADALSLAVLQLIDEGRISEEIQRLGPRHRNYGVVEAHYVTFGTALVWAIEQRLGESFTPETRAAWDKAWKLLSTAMLTAEPPAPPSN